MAVEEFLARSPRYTLLLYEKNDNNRKNMLNADYEELKTLIHQVRQFFPKEGHEQNIIGERWHAIQIVRHKKANELLNTIEQHINNGTITDETFDSHIYMAKRLNRPTDRAENLNDRIKALEKSWRDMRVRSSELSVLEQLRQQVDDAIITFQQALENEEPQPAYRRALAPLLDECATIKLSRDERSRLYGLIQRQEARIERRNPERRRQ